MAETGPDFRTTRRRFIGGAVAAGVGAAANFGASPLTAQTRGAMKIELPPLPYPDTALAPYISQNTISFHYGKHHKAYVDNTLKMIAGTDLADASLEDVIKAAAGKPDRKGLFNNSAQVWNHTFYWKSLSPKGGGEPGGKLMDRIKTDFGDFAKLKDELGKAAVTQFGSGWAWLVLDGGKLKVEQTANADNPMVAGKTPLLGIDVWEHAYYLDYQNKRPDYVTAVIDKLINWEFAAQNLG
jgi:Fe-Mn family superoxide dismutase